MMGSNTESFTWQPTTDSTWRQKNGPATSNHPGAYSSSACRHSSCDHDLVSSPVDRQSQQALVGDLDAELCRVDTCNSPCGRGIERNNVALNLALVPHPPILRHDNNKTGLFLQMGLTSLTGSRDNGKQIIAAGVDG
jgi:hypothetical protein